MKTFALVALLLAVPSIILAQVSNAGFEEWEYNRDGFESPLGWTNNTGYGPVGKIEPGHTGKYALTIWNWYCSGLGYLVTGGSAVPDSDLGDAGVPIDFLPTKLTGYYTYQLQQGPFNEFPIDSAAVYVLVKRYNPNLQDIDTISFATQLLPSSSEWTHFSVDLPLRMVGLPPDSVVIAFYTGNPRSNASASVCSFLTLDDVALTSTSGVRYDFDQVLSEVQVVPNPVADIPAWIEFEGEEDKTYRITIHNASGRLALEHDVIGSTVELSDLHLPSGAYYVSISDAAGVPVAVGRFVVE